MGDDGVRSAHSSDLEAVAVVFQRCWEISYADFLPARLHDHYAGGRAIEVWRPRLEPTPVAGLLVCEVDGQVAGLTYLPGDARYLASLYVDPLVQGRGAGRALFEAAVARCRAAGHDRLTWHTFEANAGGHRFYQRCGGVLTGASRTTPEFGVLEVEYALTLD